MAGNDSLVVAPLYSDREVSTAYTSELWYLCSVRLQENGERLRRRCMAPVIVSRSLEEKWTSTVLTKMKSSEEIVNMMQPFDFPFTIVR